MDGCEGGYRSIDRYIVYNYTVYQKKKYVRLA